MTDPDVSLRVIGTNTPKCIVYSGGVMSICKQWENTAEKNLSEESKKIAAQKLQTFLIGFG